MRKLVRNVLLAGLFLAGAAYAVGEYFASVRTQQPVYLTLSQPSPLVQGKIEIVEFFWYGCPHCYKYEPVLANWARKHADSVILRRVPAGMHEKQRPHQKVYYTLAALNRLDDLHQASFAYIHDKKKTLNSDTSIDNFAREQGIDPATWHGAFNASAVLEQAKAATELQRTYQAERVPSVAIGGRYLTSPSMVGMSLPYVGQTDEMRYKATEKLMDELLLKVKMERGLQ